MRKLHASTRLSKRALCGADGELAPSADLANCKSCKRLSIWPAHAWRAAVAIAEAMRSGGINATACMDGCGIPMIDIDGNVILVLDGTKTYTTDLGEWCGVEHYIVEKRRLQDAR